MLSPYLFNFCAEYIMWNASLDESKAGLKISRRNSNFTYANDTMLMAESEEELNSLLMKVKEENEKAVLKPNIQKTKIMASGSITSWQIEGEKVETVIDFIFLGSNITENSDCSHEIKRHLLLGRKAMTNLDSVLKSRDITLSKDLYSQSYGFPSSHEWMWELDHKEGWVLKNWCFQMVVLKSPLDSKKIQPVNPKGNQPWIFIGRTDAEADAPIFWPSAAKSRLIGKDPDSGKDWGQEKKGATEDEMVGCYHWFNGHEFVQTLGDGKGQEAWHAAVREVAESDMT